jgi:hypothetical protein
VRKVGIAWLRAVTSSVRAGASVSLAQRLFRAQKPRRQGESRDAYVERVLSGKRAGALREFGLVREHRKAKRLVRKRLPPLSGLSASYTDDEAIVGALLARAPELSDQLTLLHDVLISGGFETASALAERIEGALRRASPVLRARGVPILTRVFMATGETRRAAKLWQEAGADLPAEHPLRQALLLGLGELSEPRFVVKGAVVPYIADAAIRAGQGEQVLAAVLDSPWTILLNPELDLLVHNALRQSGGAEPSALNRFLSRYRLGRAELTPRPASENWLSRLSFAPRTRVTRGPLVSVIMSARNARHTIAYAIDSILGQTYAALELLVSDDQSDDDTYAFVAQRYAHDARVRLFRSRQNQGTYNVRNQLLAQARGELITFQDADDLSLPTRIATQVRALSASGPVASISDWLRVHPDGSIAFFPNGRAARLSVVSLMATRHAFLTAGPYPSAKVGADLDIYRRILRAYGGERIVRHPMPLLLGLWSDQSVTRSQGQPSLESGYRSPARRRYSELLFRQDLLGSDILRGASLEDELVRMGNHVAASALIAHADSSHP